MKIKDLKLLGKYHPGGSFSGMDNIGTISWNDWILEKIERNKLFLKAREGTRGEGQGSEVSFRGKAYNKLSEEQKKKIENIFENNIGNTIENILELEIS